MSNFVIGRNAVIEYLENLDDVKKLYIQKGDTKGIIEKIISIAKSKSIPIEYVDKKKLDKIFKYKNHQGVYIETEEYKYLTLNEVIEYGKKQDRAPLIILLDGITNPHNLGAIIRTAEAAGATAVVIPRHRAASVNHTVHKTSAGATTFMKIVMVKNINHAIDSLKENGYWIYGADGYTKKEYTEIDYSGAVGLVIGNEGKGISKLTKQKCDDLIKIPMYGRIESLNASTSAAILIYGVLNNRKK